MSLNLIFDHLFGVYFTMPSVSFRYTYTQSIKLGWGPLQLLKSKPGSHSKRKKGVEKDNLKIVWFVLKISLDPGCLLLQNIESMVVSTLFNQNLRWVRKDRKLGLEVRVPSKNGRNCPLKNMKSTCKLILGNFKLVQQH